jgi:hypothetical protein
VVSAVESGSREELMCAAAQSPHGLGCSKGWLGSALHSQVVAGTKVEQGHCGPRRATTHSSSARLDSVGLSEVEITNAVDCGSKPKPSDG